MYIFSFSYVQKIFILYILQFISIFALVETSLIVVIKFLTMAGGCVHRDTVSKVMYTNATLLTSYAGRLAKKPPLSTFQRLWSFAIRFEPTIFSLAPTRPRVIGILIIIWSMTVRTDLSHSAVIV